MERTFFIKTWNDETNNILGVLKTPREIYF
jgi:hypothetical protein